MSEFGSFYITHSADDPGNVSGALQAEAPRFEPLVKPLDLGRRYIYAPNNLRLIKNHFRDQPVVAVIGLNGVLSSYDSQSFGQREVNPGAVEALRTLALSMPVVLWTSSPRKDVLGDGKTEEGFCKNRA